MLLPKLSTRKIMAVVCGGLFLAVAAPAATLEIRYPLARTSYQTNELIPLTVVRSAPDGLAAGTLVLSLTGRDESHLTLTLALPAVTAQQGEARAVEHLMLNGWLLRPQTYTLQVGADGATATIPLEIYSHIRRTSFRLIQWSAPPAERIDQVQSEGEDGMGFNLSLGMYTANHENFIRAGMDFMKCCTLGGGHQLNFRATDDWSDPYVLQGGLARASLQALNDRRFSNTIGVHLFDEPGLSWDVDPTNNKSSPHFIPAQHRSFEGVFGHKPLLYREVDPAKPEQVAAWSQWAQWKLGLMEATWRYCQYGVSDTASNFLSVTQSQYGAWAFSDGYYFNIARALPIISGHGGYPDWGPGPWHPSYTLELARARDFNKPCWYLPFFGDTSSDYLRLYQYLSFMTNIQGMEAPPSSDPCDPAARQGTEGLIESNKQMARLGTIFTTLPVNRSPVGILYSMSNNILCQARDMDHTHSMFESVNMYMAGKILQHSFTYVLDEDVLDGTLAAHHKALLLEQVKALDPRVKAGIESFIRQGGLVLMTSDCEVELAGAVKLGMKAELPNPKRRAELEQTLKSFGEKLEAINAKKQPLQTQLERLNKQLTDSALAEADKKKVQTQVDELKGTLTSLDNEARTLQDQMNPSQYEFATLTDYRGKLWGATNVAKAIQPHLEKAGLFPPLRSSEPGIAVTRQASGDVEYLFVVNVTHDEKGHPQYGVKATVATLTIPDVERPLYDAMHGQVASGFQKKDGSNVATFRFGPGEMRVFARTSRPIGGVKVLQPRTENDFSRSEFPLAVAFSTLVLDDHGNPLSGSFPLRLRLKDPFGQLRYDLYRATADGTLNLRLPLAANDPAGTWTLDVEELLAGTRDTKTFPLAVTHTCGALGGVSERAAIFGQDRENVWRFFRRHHQITLVKGAGDYDAAVARLQKILKSWDVRCQVLTAAEANQPRALTPEEAQHWCGLAQGSVDLKQIDKVGVERAGFAVNGPVVLIGTPEDNPLIKFLLEPLGPGKNSFLTFKPEARTFPGPRRGYVAWTRDGISYGQEALALIAYDPAGMDEAIGTLYEAQAGQQALTPFVLATQSEVAAATKGQAAPEPKINWTLLLPDRAVALKAEPAGIQVLSADGTLSRVSADGKLVEAKEITTPLEQAKAACLVAADPAILEAAKKLAEPGRTVKFAQKHGEYLAVGYWGGGLRFFGADGKVRAATQLQHDINGMASVGDLLIVALSDASLQGLRLP